VIYTRRKRALEGERLKTEILEFLEEYVEDVLDSYFDNADAESIHKDILNHLLVDIKIEPEDFENLGKDGIKEKIVSAAKDFYSKKEEMLESELMARLERYAMLSVIDEKWKEHLRDMDDLKEGIHLRAYGQKDPLIEYKGEAYKLFVALLEDIRNEVVSFTFKFFPQAPAEIQERKPKKPLRLRTIKVDSMNMGMQGGGEQQDEGAQRGKQQPVRVEKKVGRNDPCPCGSGKKYKNCHGKNL